MEISIRTVHPSNSGDDPLRVLPGARSADDRKGRRGKQQDRKKNIKEGVFVSLSVKEGQFREEDGRKDGN